MTDNAETPRTDLAALRAELEATEAAAWETAYGYMLEHARTLERELADAKQQLALLCMHNAGLQERVERQEREIAAATPKEDAFFRSADLEHIKELEERLREMANALREAAAAKERLENAYSALGEHPDSDFDIAERIGQIRDEGRAHFHTVTRLQEQLATAKRYERLVECAKRVVIESGREFYRGDISDVDALEDAIIELGHPKISRDKP